MRRRAGDRRGEAAAAALGADHLRRRRPLGAHPRAARADGPWDPGRRLRDLRTHRHRPAVLVARGGLPGPARRAGPFAAQPRPAGAAARPAEGAAGSGPPPQPARAAGERPPRPPGQDQLSPEDLRALQDGNVAIGNHTLGHPCLARCDDSTVHAEITGAHQALTRWLGEPPTAFAYPNGGYDPRADTLLRQLGYRLGFLSDHRLGPRLPVHPLRISRLQVDSTTSSRRFDTILSGLEPAVQRWRKGPTVAE
ncbi:polysaccharide deacetylase family protein [Kitasatospora gansuensis]